MDRYVPLPPLPPRISRLNELASDLWWSWNADAREVFRDLDYPLWRFTDHNPVLLLHLVEPERLAHAAGDEAFLRLYDAAIAGLDVVRSGAGTWWARAGGSSRPIALVCREFALHQSLPIDTAGLGVIAGDACKEASDLGVPLVGLGLMYPRGYVHQRLSGEGWQQDAYEYLDWSDAPIGPALCADGSRCAFWLPLASGDVRVQVWQVRAGRVTIYLLDTDVPDNQAWDRELSSGAYAADAESAVRQGVLLGAGAVRALNALGIEPCVWHVHETAAAFVAAARLQALTAGGAEWEAALARVRQTTVFNTRAPRPRRDDGATFAAVERQTSACWPGLPRESLLTLGRADGDRGAFFDPAAFAVRTSGRVNTSAASAGDADPWRALAPHAPERTSLAPGVHLGSWLSRDLAEIFTTCLGADWRERQDDETFWAALSGRADLELWQMRQRLRGYLIDFVRERARRRWAREQSSGSRLVALGTLLDPRTLTIGLARRFTHDARADLIFTDAHRLAAILTAPRRPVQVIIAGRAPAGDEAGKHQLQRVFRRVLDPMFGGRLAFLEDYDLHAARLMVQGCDVWLSTPPAASLPSMGAIKAAINGAPHLATAPAWWPGEWTGENGWVIDGGRAADQRAHDAADARALYRLLEETIVPAFYDRGRGGVPLRWTARMAGTIASTLPRFCARRAVKDMAALDGIIQVGPQTSLQGP